MSQQRDFMSVRLYAKNLRREGLVDSGLIDSLVSTITDDSSAYQVLGRLKEAHARAQGLIDAAASRRRRRDATVNNVASGTLWIVGGLVVSVVLESVLGGLLPHGFSTTIAGLISLGCIAYVVLWGGSSDHNKPQ